MLPTSQLIENCDQWHLCELADRWDGSIVSVAVLRRDLVRHLTTFHIPNDTLLMNDFQDKSDRNTAEYLR